MSVSMMAALVRVEPLARYRPHAILAIRDNAYLSLRASPSLSCYRLNVLFGAAILVPDDGEHFALLSIGLDPPRDDLQIGGRNVRNRQNFGQDPQILSSPDLIAKIWPESDSVYDSTAIDSDQSKRTTQYEWAKAMKADLLIIVRQVARKLSEPKLTELYRLWRHWCAEVERLALD